MTIRPVRVTTRAYRAVTRLLPETFREAYQEEMTELFDDLLGAAECEGRRTRFLASSYAALLRVAAVEWYEVLLRPALSEAGNFAPSRFVADLRIATRGILRVPTFAVTVVLLIGLGMGAATTVFALFDHVLLRALPYPAAQTLVFVGDGPEREAWEAHSGPVIRDLVALSAFDGVAVAHSEPATLMSASGPIRVSAATVSEDFFDVFGGNARMGRLLLPDDFDGAQAAVLSSRSWERLFDGDPDVLGRQVTVDGIPRTVVGILGADFVPPRALVSGTVDVWVTIDWAAPEMDRVDSEWLEVVGRLAPGMSRQNAQVQLDRLAVAFGNQHPDRFLEDDGSATPLPLIPLHEATVQRVRGGLALLLGAVALLLLVACLNVAHLFLARAVSRAQEMDVRRALGGSTASLVQLLFAESLILGVTGGVLGVIVASIGLDGLLAILPAELPVANTVGVDTRILAVAGAVSLATAVIFGLIPALRVSRLGSGQGLGSSWGSTTGRRAGRWRNGLVVAEVALSLVLVAQAGLLAQSLLQMVNTDPGLDPAGVWTVPLSATDGSMRGRLSEVMDEVSEAVSTVPEVASVTYSLTLPFEYTGGERSGWSNRVSWVINGEVAKAEGVRFRPVTMSYFRTLGVPVLFGEVWSGLDHLTDDAQAIVPVMLNERAATHLFGSAEKSVGRVVEAEGAPERKRRITGVVADVRHFGLDQPVPFEMFLPASLAPAGFDRAHLAMRVRGAPAPGFQQRVREAVWQAAPQLPVPIVQPLDEWISRSQAVRRFDSTVFAMFGSVALVLAGVGLYGTLLYQVRQRYRELGIRLALGATPRMVQSGVVGGGLRLALIGSVIGLGLALASGRFLEARLYGVDPMDPVPLLAAAGLLVLVAGLASWAPARKASRVNPREILSAE